MSKRELTDNEKRYHAFEARLKALPRDITDYGVWFLHGTAGMSPQKPLREALEDWAEYKERELAEREGRKP